MAIKIVTDSTSYIPKEYLDKYDIEIISLNIILNDVSIRELDIDINDFYNNLDLSAKLPTSSQPIPDEMYSCFESIVKSGDTVLGIFMSSQMSGTFSSANLVKELILENYPDANIHIFDSKTNCMQMGYIALEAAKAANENKDIIEILRICDETLNNSRFLFTPHTLEYLKKGGRIGGASALLGQILQIKPILTVRDGKTEVLTKVRTKKKAIQTIISTFLDDIKGKTLGDVIVHHISDENEGRLLLNELKKHIDIDIQLQSIGPVIGLHVGPSSVGIAYYTK